MRCLWIADSVVVPVALPPLSLLLFPVCPAVKPPVSAALDERNLCLLFGDPRRPAVCGDFKADEEVCGTDNQTALDNLTLLEDSTAIIVRSH